jgi:hypothetical protein
MADDYDDYDFVHSAGEDSDVIVEDSSAYLIHAAGIREARRNGCRARMQFHFAKIDAKYASEDIRQGE